jgi:carotenoid 1,2-hydratase
VAVRYESNSLFPTRPQPVRQFGAPRFDRPVPRDGYAWWYVDALSDDGRYGLTVIAFVGSVFSPYYAHRRRQGPADPLEHCALNVALYGPDHARWAMTERGRTAVRRGADTFEIGPSALEWDGHSLSIHVDEVAMPVPLRVRGRIRLTPTAGTHYTAVLDATGLHRWSPIAPEARVEVEFAHPGLRWAGTGYLDSNSGDAPLETAFASWHWSRAALCDGAAVLYDVERRDGDRLSLALKFDRHGGVHAFEPPPVATLPRSGWRVERLTRSELARAKVVRTLTDAPFYARSEVRQRLYGQDVAAIHESLSLDRFAARWVQVLLPFRMPRVAR